MLRSIEARRGLRRALAVVCSSLAITAVAAAVAGRDEAALAEPAPPRSGGEASAPHPAAVAPASPARPPAEPAPAPWPASRQLLTTEAGNRVFAYPPLPAAAGGPEATGAAPARGPMPVVMMLHGMCGDARFACDFWSDAGREGSWLICPGGNARCGEYDDWKGTGEDKAAALDQAIEAVDRAYGAGAVTHAAGDILIGFSRGAFVARDVAYARPGRFRALVLLGASLSPDAARLKASGIQKIVMAAGEYDGARPTMQRAARALDAAGIPTRYVSLGRIPHALPDNLGEILRVELAWIRERAPERAAVAPGDG
jgi:predicted esterase